MILHTGNRTDLPAFYAPWLRRRLEAGFVLARSPYRPSDVIRYRLTPDLVDLLVFCTKNPGAHAGALGRIAPYGQYWFVTITPYGPEIEPQCTAPGPCHPNLSGAFPSDRPRRRGMAVRSGFPQSRDYPLERHLADFSAMGAAAGRLYPYLRHQLHRPVRQGPAQLPGTPGRGRRDRITLGRELARIASSCGMTLKACAEGGDLAPFGVDCSGCMTVEVFERRWAHG